MKFILFILSVIYLITGCSTKEPKKEISHIDKGKNYYFVEEFIYKKNQIDYFEKEFENILNSNNLEVLKKFKNFYETNSSYFLNGFKKVALLEEKIENFDTSNKNSHRYLLTKALSVDKQEAIKIYEKLAKEDNIFAMRELANLYKYDNKVLSIIWFEKLVEKNDIQSIKDYAFANLRMVSPIIVQNVKKAVELYEKLDSLGEVSGLVHLGNIYEYGYFKDEFPLDKQKALKYYEKAAKQNYTPAQKKLAKIYLCQECEEDRYNKEKGIEILKKLTSKGDDEAKELLIKLSSIGTEEPIEQ